METQLNIALTEFFRPIVAQCVQEAIQKISLPSNNVPDIDPYGDFKWLMATCHGVPASTLRIKSAAGEIPGVVKFGKRVLYEKATVLSWLRSQTRMPVDVSKIEQAASEHLAKLSNRQEGKVR